MPTFYTTKLVVTLMTIISLSSLSAQTPCIRIVFVDPLNDLVTLQSFEDEEIDMSEYVFCSLLSCDSLAEFDINFGSLVIPPGDSVQLVYEGLSDNSSDVGLYLNFNQFDTEVMVDFMQYEGSLGLFNHATADEKGIWESGTFIETAAPYVYYGDGCENNGVDFWSDPNGLSTYELDARLSFRIDPQQIEISMTDLRSAQVKIVDVSGREWHNAVNYDRTHRINTADLPTGMYFVMVLVDNAIVTKKMLFTN